jgi:hypothetical protein
MRKALMGFILAATVMTPIAAEAQRGHRGGGDGDRGSHSRGNNGGGESRAARIEARNEARQTQSNPQPQQQQAPQPRAQVAQQPRGDRGNRGGGDGNRGGWNRGGGGDGDRGGRRNQPSIYPQAWQGNPNDPRLQRYRELERRNQNSGYSRRGDRDRDGRNWRNDDRNDRNWRDGRRGDRRNWRNEWNRGWRNDNRYNWSGWRNRNRHAYHLSPYYSPYRNWSYRRFSIGLFLDSLFYNQRYWIGDPWQYRLPPAPYGTQWVRYYNDVLLVDIYTGEVVDAIYDFFW